MVITKIRHAWPEKKGFMIDRPSGQKEYVLLHFWKSMNILCDEGEIASKPYALIIYDIGSAQRFYNYEQDIVHDWIHITGDIESIMKSCGMKLNHLYYPDNNRYITETIREMESEFFLQGMYYKDIIDIKLRELILRCARDINRRDSAAQIDDNMRENLLNLRQKMFSSLEKEISVAQMAREINISESRFYVLYKSLFGMSPTKDLIYARVQRAKFLIAQKKYRICEVAAMCGYRSEQHFIRQFKSLTGITPGKYE